MERPLVALALLDVNELPPAEEGGTPIAWRDQLIEKVISLQKADGSWNNDFLTKRNAAALKSCTAADARIAYKKAMRNLRLRGVL